MVQELVLVTDGAIVNTHQRIKVEGMGILTNNLPLCSKSIVTNDDTIETIEGSAPTTSINQFPRTTNLLHHLHITSVTLNSG
ncbi:hypothetical protein D3C71_1790210 [compost metagenome]